MAAPLYEEDLTDISLAEASTTGYLQVNFAGGGGGALDFGPDFSMQGNDAILRQVTNNDRGAAFDNAATIAGTVATGVHIYQWGFVATPGITDTLQNGGATVFAGTGAGDVVKYHVEGSDTFGAQGRVGICYAYRYDTSSTASEPYRTVVGSPGATPSVFGFSMKTIATSKGVNLGCDAVRYGTGAYLTAGELISDGDASDNPCTFDGFATQNDVVANRWGILSLAGATYELQGKFVIGQTSGKVATTCKFQDADRTVACVDATHAEFDFCEIVVDGASTVCNLTNINYTTLGPWQKGLFTVNAGTLTISGGTWSDIGTVDFGTTTTATGLFIQNGETATLGTGSTVTDCRFSWVRRDDPELTASTNDINGLIVNNFNQITTCRFSGSDGHHVYVNGIFGAGTTQVTWDSTIDGTASISDINVDVPSGATLEVIVSGDVPTFTNRAGTPGTISVLQNQTTVTLSPLQTNSEVRVYSRDGSGNNDTELAGVENSGTSFQFSLTAGTIVNFVVFSKAYEPIYFDAFEVPFSNQTVQIQQRFDRNFSGTPD
jgi:hypothetical protein